MGQTIDHMRSWAEGVSPLSDRELRPAVRRAKRWDAKRQNSERADIRTLFRLVTGTKESTAANGMQVPAPDSHLEKVLRALMITEARTLCNAAVSE
jgi:hypothetical protein